MEFGDLKENGYVEIEFRGNSPLRDIQQLVEGVFHCQPTHWHTQENNEDQHLTLVKKVTDDLARTDLIARLVESTLDDLMPLLGPDIDIQAVPHFRVSRPSRESDFVDWHRDTFYGNAPHELNLWFPVYPLQQGAGLLMLNGSHVVPSRNIRVAQDENEFRKSVQKGSTANQLGYVYLPKTDDTIAGKDPQQIKLITPAFEHGVLFFGCAVHRAQNDSDQTRVTIDLRLRNAHTPTETKPGYYKPLCRGIVEQCVQRFLNKNSK